MSRSSQGAVVQALARELPIQSLAGEGSSFDSLIATGGYYEDMDLTVDGNGAQTDNLFQVTGIVEVKELLFHIETVTDITTFSNCKFDLFPGPADITDTVDVSGAVVGSIVYKRGLKTASAILLDVNSAFVSEAAANKLSFEPFFVGKEDTANTYIRLSFTGDANTNVAIHVQCRWRPFTHDGMVVSV